MPIRQRQLFTATEFDFRPDRLRYTFKTPRGAKQLVIDYADISLESRRIEERHAAYLYVGLVLGVLGTILGAYLYTVDQRTSGFAYALWGILFVVAYFVQRSTFVVFSVGGDPLIVLEDGNAAEIISRIERHRKQRFVELLVAPDLVADAAKKQEFVSWLLARKVFTADEVAALTGGSGTRDDKKPL